MLMIDGQPEHLCTCLLFMKPVPAAKELLVLWEKEIITIHAKQDQASLSSNSFGVKSFRSNSSGRSSMRKSTQQQCWLPPTLVPTFCRKI